MKERCLPNRRRAQISTRFLRRNASSRSTSSIPHEMHSCVGRGYGASTEKMWASSTLSIWARNVVAFDIDIFVFRSPIGVWTS